MIEVKNNVWINPHQVSSMRLNDFTHLDRGNELSIRMFNGDEFIASGEPEWINIVQANITEALAG